jgi:hypothetical protein
MFLCGSLSIRAANSAGDCKPHRLGARGSNRPER